MKTLFYLTLMGLVMGCQSESLNIQAPYRIRLQAASPGASLKLHQPYALSLELLTDSYYSKYGYQLIYYQQTGLGRLDRGNDIERESVLQNVPFVLPLGASSWRFTPEAPGVCQIVLVAQQERGYTQPDTVRMNFQVVP